MRKSLYVAVALLVGTTACQVVETLEPASDRLTISITADPVYEDGIGPETKAVIHGTKMYWSPGDTLGVFPDRGSQVYFLVDSEGEAISAPFDGGAWEFKANSIYTSYYPLVGEFYLTPDRIPVQYYKEKDGVIKLQTQVGNDSSVHTSEYLYMYTDPQEVINGNISFAYHHLWTVLKPIVTLPAGHYTKLTFSLDEPLFVVKGYFDLTSDAPAIIGTEFASEVSMNLDVTFDAPTELTAYYATAPLDMQGKTLTITITEQSGAEYAYTYNPSKAYKAGTTYRLASAESFMRIPEAIDLGLSVKWASFNLGASMPEEYGNYYSWGETNPKGDSVPGNYKWFDLDNENDYVVTKYCQSGKTLYWGGIGSPDGKTELKDYDYEDDAAYVNLGGGWRMPADTEWTELRENCMWKYTTKNGRSGYLVTSNVSGYTDKSIFLPAAGSQDESGLSYAGSNGVYWSSTLSDYPLDARDVYFSSLKIGRGDGSRFAGLSVRPVIAVFSPDELKVKGIKLDKEELIINEGETYSLISEIIPSRAIDKSVRWSSSNPSVATVDSEGKITGVAVGVTTITVTTNDGNLTASCEVAVPEAVDLGLSVNWATFNVGALTSLEYGDFFAWGETEPKEIYDWSTYKWCNGSNVTLTKYNTDSTYGIVDNNKDLDPEDDAAHVNWGGNWRMPSLSEWQDLYNNCTSHWAWYGRIGGVEFTSSNGKSIFLPASGCPGSDGLYGINEIGIYWSSTLYYSEVSNLGPDCACFLGFNNIQSVCYVEWNFLYRYYGFSIRPVCPKN